MTDSVFIGAIIVAVTQAIKELAPNVRGFVTIVVAIVVGAVVGWLDIHIGLPDLTIAQSILTGLAAVGVTTVATKIG